MATKGTKHLSEFAKKWLLNLCSKPEFRERVAEVRRGWGIEAPMSFDKARGFWEGLCEASRKEPDYHERWDEGKTADRRFQKDLEDLCLEFGLFESEWITMFRIVACLDLAAVREEDILTLPLPYSLARIAIAPYGINPIKPHHLYLDVTWATKVEDINEIWEMVDHWQRKVRPFLVARGLLPDLLADIDKGGRPPISEERLIELAEHMADGMTVEKLAEDLGRSSRWIQELRGRAKAIAPEELKERLAGRRRRHKKQI